MKPNINQIIRSVVVLIIGLPVSLTILSQVPKPTEETAANKLKEELMLPCLKYALTKPDSKGERESKNDIDEAFADADYSSVCKWVLG